MSLSLRYVVLFAIERKASGEDQVPQNVLLTFVLEFSVNGLLTSPVLIWWSRLGLPALAVALLRRHLPEPDTTSVGDDCAGGGDQADDGSGEVAHGASTVAFAQRWRRRAAAAAAERRARGDLEPDDAGDPGAPDEPDGPDGGEEQEVASESLAEALQRVAALHAHEAQEIELAREQAQRRERARREGQTFEEALNDVDADEEGEAAALRDERAKRLEAQGSGVEKAELRTGGPPDAPAGAGGGKVWCMEAAEAPCLGGGCMPGAAGGAGDDNVFEEPGSVWKVPVEPEDTADKDDLDLLSSAGEDWPSVVVRTHPPDSPTVHV